MNMVNATVCTLPTTALIIYMIRCKAAICWCICLSLYVTILYVYCHRGLSCHMATLRLILSVDSQNRFRCPDGNNICSTYKEICSRFMHCLIGYRAGLLKLESSAIAEVSNAQLVIARTNHDSVHWRIHESQDFSELNFYNFSTF